MSTKTIPQRIFPQTYYVYTLAYPDGNIFYVGKGSNGRIADHERDAMKECQCRKCQLIREIWASGYPIQKRIVFETFDESEAFEHEKALIDLYASQLVNVKDNPYIAPPVMPEIEEVVVELPVLEPEPPVSIELVTPEPVPPLPKEFEVPLTSEQAGRMLGVNPRVIIGMAKRGEIPFFRAGDLWKFHKSDIEAWIAEQKQKVLEAAF